MRVIAVRPPNPARSWLLGWALFGSAVACGGCRGTEHLVFEPIPVAGPVVSAPHDAGTTPMKPPVVDAGHPKKKPALIDDDAGPLSTTGADPGLDANVMFVWKQTLPGQGTCRAGRYVGKFTCTISVDGGVPDPAQMLQGAVSFTLSGSPEDAMLSVMLGDVSGPLFTSTLDGKLDCVAKRFVGSTSEGYALLGTGTGGDGADVVMLFPSFDATLDGTFDDQTLTIAGMFEMKNGSGQTCEGRFRVSALP